MRGSAQPFHQWDSAFNTSASGAADEGVVVDVGTLQLRPHFGVWAGHIDNVYTDHDGAVADIYYTLAPGIMLTYGDEDGDYLSANYVYEVTTYNQETALGNDSHLISVGAHFSPSQFRFQLSDQFSTTQETEPESAQITAMLANIESLTVSRYVSRKTSFVLEQRYGIHEFEGDAFLDYNEIGLGARLQHQTFPKVSTSIGGEYGLIDMSRSDVIGDATYVEAGLGFQGRMTSKSTIHARLGWQKRRFEDDIQAINDGVGLIGLSSRYSSRTQWGLDVSRSLTPSSLREGYSRISTRIMPSYRHILWRNRLSVSLSGAYELADYYGPQGQEDRNDLYWYASGGLDWHPGRLFTMGIGYSHTEQKSDTETNEYDQNHLFVRVMSNY